MQKKEGFKPVMKELVGDGIPIIISTTVSGINDRQSAGLAYLVLFISERCKSVLEDVGRAGQVDE